MIHWHKDIASGRRIAQCSRPSYRSSTNRPIVLRREIIHAPATSSTHPFLIALSASRARDDHPLLLKLVYESMDSPNVFNNHVLRFFALSLSSSNLESRIPAVQWTTS